MARRGGGLPAGWVLPHWADSGQPAGSRIATAVGNVDSGVVARIDPRGLVVPIDRGWSLDWWVCAEDGWHAAASEPAGRVHQLLLDDAPVVETALRVPGGEVVHRVYAARADAEVVVVEVENRSHVPVALALAVRPYDLATTGTVKKVALAQHAIIVAGRHAIALPKPPAFAAAATGDVDVADLVFAGTQQRPGSVGEVRDRRGLASLAVVYPLPHTAVLRVAVAAGPVDVGRLPPADHVARGWRAHSNTGTRVAVPDERLQSAVSASLAALLLHADALAFDEPLVLGALERWGFDHVAEEIAQRRGFCLPSTGGFTVSEDALDLGHGGVLDQLAACVHAASPTWTWPAAGAHPARAAAKLLLLVRAALVAERAGGVDFWPEVDPSWLGQAVEVHDAPTSAGSLSCAVRWHGARPAVLWDGPGGVVLRAPALDPTWSSTDAAGEALLAPVEPAGGLPKVYGGLPVPDGLDEPDRSFS
ncbi:MAG: hypothetical protein ABIV94_06505 [Acidimicrobiales bacterium]